MKHFYYLVALLSIIFTTPHAFAQETQSQKPMGLTGIWQMCQSIPDGIVPLQTGPFLKIFGKNGELTNLMLNAGNGVSVVTATGAYAQISDSTYTETMTFATFAPLIGRPNLMKFKLIDDKYLCLEFRVEGAMNPNLLKETWIRVTPPSTNAVVASKPAPAPMKHQREDGVYVVADVMPEFRGGMNELMKYLGANIKYPEEASKKNIEGRVIIQFIVDPEGNITVPKVIRAIHPLIDAEAMRVISTMPRWIPGTVDGKAVPVLFTVPIMFKLPAVPKTNPLVAAN